MNYISTRDVKKEKICSAEAIKRGQAPDGGLYVPEYIPKINSAFINELCGLDYSGKAAKILSLYLTDYTQAELELVCRQAYGTERFTPSPAPVKTVDGNNILELWHGPTCAFKDLALQLLPRLLSLALEKTNEKNDALILVATSGDTGKAALEGYSDVERVRIIVFYPNDGVSNMQKLQMQSQKGSNVEVVAINGNFDDAQTGVKRIFSDREAAKTLSERGFILNSANSINFGRLAPQIVYYFSAYCQLLENGTIKSGDKINVTVPTGNFGNILAAFMAKEMGLPIDKLVCATNKNNVLADYFTNGVYDKNREFYTTASPSMDILVSSNLERLIYFAYGPEKTAQAMKSLRETGRFNTSLDHEYLKSFYGMTCNEDNTRAAIAKAYKQTGYCLDPHTAVAVFCANEYKLNSGDTTPMLVVSTASPYKFPYAVSEALNIKADEAFQLMEKISELTKTKIPAPLAALKTAEIRFRDLIDDFEMKNKVMCFAEKPL